MQPPIAGQVVLGWDPAFRTGCKLAVVDPTGKVLDTTVIYPTAPQNKVEEAKTVLKKLISKYHITLISLGNGTASRESEQVIVEFIKRDSGRKYSILSSMRRAHLSIPQVNLQQRNFRILMWDREVRLPWQDVCRIRWQSLVKIDPKSIGVGQYQHDMNQKKLSEALSGVVEDCVNKVGVDLNTASASLLEYISGISKVIAKNIVAYREENGRFAIQKPASKSGKIRTKGLRAVCRIYAYHRWQKSVGCYRCASGEL